MWAISTVLDPGAGAGKGQRNVGSRPIVSVGGPLACVVASTFVHFASLYYLLPTLPPPRAGARRNDTEIGLIIGVLALTSLAVRPLLGIWMDRARRRRLILAGAGIYALASLGHWASRSIPGLPLWRVFHGAGLATFSTAVPSQAIWLPRDVAARPWRCSASLRLPR